MERTWPAAQCEFIPVDLMFQPHPKRPREVNPYAAYLMWAVLLIAQSPPTSMNTSTCELACWILETLDRLRKENWQYVPVFLLHQLALEADSEVEMNSAFARVSGSHPIGAIFQAECQPALELCCRKGLLMLGTKTNMIDPTGEWVFTPAKTDIATEHCDLAPTNEDGLIRMAYSNHQWSEGMSHVREVIQLSFEGILNLPEKRIPETIRFPSSSNVADYERALDALYNESKVS
eukprot:Protomagalhaensia_sp_Gyna_25__5206@NODE_627_length_2969_cov_16_655973_g486_i0_p3_GENE_NODE_627_length_2969_cov_16_655973_g486_i0NODE_627_length_2969_cov_16_655973_g486_i0_p3_ORF_typecomplete_len234_score39_40Phage_holin_2_1/PF04971_12/0_36_NODE_627_length_2969_cov_16_655973_g486_i09851686